MSSTELDPDLFLPEPTPAEVRYTVVSVDDHVVEPGHVFADYLPAAMVERGPQLREADDGSQFWEYDGETFTMGEANAFSGRRPETVERAPFRLSNMRPAPTTRRPASPTWTSTACGHRSTSPPSSADSVAACSSERATWIWAGRASTPGTTGSTPSGTRRTPTESFPVAWPISPTRTSRLDRFAPMRRAGFVSISMPERPHAIGLPSWWDRDHWDPIIHACVETDTVLSFHVGSSGVHEAPPGSPDRVVWATLFGQLSLQACAEFLWSGYPLRLPSLKVAMSEGGIGWVPMLLDRLDNLKDRSGIGDIWEGERASEILLRNFWFCSLDDPSTIELRHRIGVENIMVEVDYPHSDSTWPSTQQVIHDAWGHIPATELRLMCAENAAQLFRVRLPDPVMPRMRDE